MNFDSSVLQVAVEDIVPNRFQPRLAFEDTSLNELAASIKQHGIIQPLVLRRMGDKYEIVAGERRFRAAKMAGLVAVPAVISNIDDRQSAEIAIAENVQRKELTAIEEAKSYKALLDQGYMSQAQLAMKLGLSESSIANKLRLLTLAPEVQNAVMDGSISERHARSLLVVKDNDAQVRWLKRIIDERMTVRLLDLELRKEYGQVYLNQGVDIEKVKQNAVDIPTYAPLPDTSVQEQNSIGAINLGERSTNKFFNNLESEAVNMQMTEAVNPFNQQNNLFDLSSKADNNGFAVAKIEEENKEEEKEEPMQTEIQPQMVQEQVSPVQTYTPVPAAAPVSAPVQPAYAQVPPQPVQPTPTPIQPVAAPSIEDLDFAPAPAAAPMPVQSTPPAPMPEPVQTAPVPQTPVPTSTKSMNEVKSKLEGVIAELKALGYNVNSSSTELSNTASFIINVSL